MCYSDSIRSAPNLDTDDDTIFDCRDQFSGQDDRTDIDQDGPPDGVVPTVIPAVRVFGGALILGLTLLALSRVVFRAAGAARCADP